MEKVIIWGCGKYGRKIFAPLVMQHNVKVAAYVDSDSKKWGTICNGVDVISPQDIGTLEYDLIMLTVNHPISLESIKNDLKSLEVPQDKIINLMTDLRYIDLFMDQRFSWIKDFSEWIAEKGIGGNIAECGVFRGESAKFLNKFFKDKTFYLFDTFEGFADKDLQYEMDKKNDAFNESVFANTPIFDVTSIDYVIKKMSYPQNVVIKQGYFPETAEGLEDQFCFVNLDMDLYLPMLNGLRYFWDRVEKGGCILLHDYFAPELPGVNEAVSDFEKERKITICKVPIGDGCSIALLK